MEKISAPFGRKLNIRSFVARPSPILFPLGAILRDTLKQIVVTKNKNKIAYYKYTYYICTYNLTRQII
jgi:hypothetical protein